MAERWVLGSGSRNGSLHRAANRRCGDKSFPCCPAALARSILVGQKFLQPFQRLKNFQKTCFDASSIRDSLAILSANTETPSSVVADTPKKASGLSSPK